MQPRHVMIALVVALVWGGNFAVTTVALQDISVFLLLCLRFIFMTLPFIFFVKRPREVSFGFIALLSCALYMCKFGLVFGSLSVGLSPGIASLALQTQVLFTILFSALIFKTKITPKQILGTLTSLTGMGIIAFQEHGGGNILGFAFILCAAVVWAFSNILYRKAKDVDAFALTIWMGIFPPLPFFALSVGVDGWDSVLHTLTHFDTKLTLCLGFIVVCASWIGSTCWAYLFKKYDASVVAPYSLLIPVFGILTSWLFLGESYSPMAMVACAIIFAGLIINQWPIKKNA